MQGTGTGHVALAGPASFQCSRHVGGRSHRISELAARYQLSFRLYWAGDVAAAYGVTLVGQ
jgi:hypothetical protein